MLRNALKIAKKREKRKKKRTNRAKTSERYVTGKSGQAICYEALHGVRGV